MPDDHRLGDVNDGWTVALTTLMNERAVDRRRRRRRRRLASVDPRSSRWCATSASTDDPIVRQKLADLYIHVQVAEVHQPAGAWTRSRPASCPGPEMSIAKLALTAEHAAHGASSSPTCSARSSSPTPASGAPTRGAQFVLGTPGMRIAGGTDEVMRNIVGERVLGLPKDAGIDSNSPFKDLPKN